MNLCGLLGKNDNSCLWILAILAFVCCGCGEGILDCLCNLDTCAILCIIIFVLYCCGVLSNDDCRDDEDRCRCR